MENTTAKNTTLVSAHLIALSGAFVLGNILFPQVCHLVPLGGKTMLPIYFFTLIAAFRCGWKVALITALASPLLNHLLFSMPPIAAMPPVLVKSTLIAALTPPIAHFCNRKILPTLLLSVAGYQLLGAIFEWTWTGEFAAAAGDIHIGWPGMLFQIAGGWALLKLLAKNDTAKGLKPHSEE